MSRTRVLAALALSTAIAFPVTSRAQAFNGGLIGSCSVGGTCGTVNGSDGVVGPSGLAGSTAYGYVVTPRGSNSATNGLGYGITGDRLGSMLSYSFSTVNPNTVLSFRFNYITRDGGEFPDYGFAHLFDAGLNRTVLFNARTTPSGNTFPGGGLPAPSAGVTLTPPSATIIAGAPNWSPLGVAENNSQALGTNCWAAGCGYTGWVTASFTIAAAGNYRLDFGVMNQNDNQFQSGLAFDFALNNGVPTTPTVAPEPSTSLLIAAGLAGLFVAVRRRRA